MTCASRWFPSSTVLGSFAVSRCAVPQQRVGSPSIDYVVPFNWTSHNQYLSAYLCFLARMCCHVYQCHNRREGVWPFGNVWQSSFWCQTIVANKERYQLSHNRLRVVSQHTEGGQLASTDLCKPPNAGPREALTGGSALPQQEEHNGNVNELNELSTGGGANDIGRCNTEEILTLFQFAVCPSCNGIRAVLDYARIPYRVIEVNPLTREQIIRHRKVLDDFWSVPILILPNGSQYNGQSAVLNCIRRLLEVDTAVFEEEELDWISNDLSLLLYMNMHRTILERYGKQ
eukprot:GHVQ01023149.1.p1 GENE.GHVQ01023149.1~~GHVQ01023149.1.p1  ORF type:complete len:287 (-),score=29.18 GHVQ01023149.1:124-984(-)